jgi:hypothetical protein
MHTPVQPSLADTRPHCGRGAVRCGFARLNTTNRTADGVVGLIAGWRARMWADRSNVWDHLPRVVCCKFSTSPLAAWLLHSTDLCPGGRTCPLHAGVSFALVSNPDTYVPLTAQVALMTTDWSYSDNYGNLGGVDIGYIEFGLSEFCFKTSVNTFQDSEHLVCFEYDVSRHLTSVPVAPSPPAPTVPATAHAASRKP